MQIDYESYDWKKLDPKSEETKKIVQDYFSWSGTDSQGRKFNQGKIFKWAASPPAVSTLPFDTIDLRFLNVATQEQMAMLLAMSSNMSSPYFFFQWCKLNIE